jgi:hypothetical protein
VGRTGIFGGWQLLNILTTRNLACPLNVSLNTSRADPRTNGKLPIL